MKTIKELEDTYGLSRIDSTELYNLIDEVSEKNFTHSHLLSKYIKENRLGNKYPNISGIVKMQKESDAWDFEGGFPTNIYRIVCIELGLQNLGSSARVTGFTSYKDLNRP